MRPAGVGLAPDRPEPLPDLTDARRNATPGLGFPVDGSNAGSSGALPPAGQQSGMLGWLIGGLVLAVFGMLLTLVWWRVGDQWADEEHKRLPTRGRNTSAGDAPRVIRTERDD